MPREAQQVANQNQEIGVLGWLVGVLVGPNRVKACMQSSDKMSRASTNSTVACANSSKAAAKDIKNTVHKTAETLQAYMPPQNATLRHKDILYHSGNILLGGMIMWFGRYFVDSQADQSIISVFFSKMASTAVAATGTALIGYGGFSLVRTISGN